MGGYWGEYQVSARISGKVSKNLVADIRLVNNRPSTKVPYDIRLANS